jgi:2-amino-4-hydroxy-6-hydroxymethyldihydropteridine diphosphokinase
MAQSRTPDTVSGVVAYIGLGGNLGDARAAVLAALDAIAALPDVDLLAASSLYGSAPVDSTGDDYVNAVAKVQTTRSADSLLDALQAIENGAGRERPYRNAPRTLDLDVLLYAEDSIQTQRLTVPHPRMGERAFVLMPLAEIAPHLVIPQQLELVQGQGVWPL